MKRVLKNYQKIGIKYPFRGKEIWFGPKQSQIFDMDNEEDRARYNLWIDRYGFIGDITERK